MKIKSLIAFVLTMILIAGLCACSDSKKGGEDSNVTTAENGGESPETTTAVVADETSAAVEDTSAEKDEDVAPPVPLPTTKSGTLEDSNLVVTNITAYDRKSDGTLVRETSFKKLGIKKGTVEKDGKTVEAFVGTYKAEKGTDTVFFNLECSLKDITGVVLGRQFDKKDGKTEFVSKYTDGKSDVLPLIITVEF